MAKRNQSAARRIEEQAPEKPAVEVASVPRSPTRTYDDLERAFFDKADAGRLDPPVYLPYDSVIVPVLGVLVLLGLSFVVML